MDAYDKMGEFLVKNNLDNCNFCKAIELNSDNSCCDDKKWCVKGIAAYLREHEILE